MRSLLLLCCCSIFVGAVGCDEMKDNPRTTGTVAGAAAGAAIGAGLDKDDRGTGAVLGGAAGAAAGNAGGAVYKDQNRDGD